MDGQPLISVIVPAYNVEPYLSRCLQSIAGQTYTHIEVIVVNDGSVDGTGRVADEWAAADERFHVFHKKNGGPSRARNFALQQAHGEFVAFVDSDDFLAPQYLDVLVRKALEHEADYVMCDWELFPDGEKPQVPTATDSKCVVYTPSNAFHRIMYQKHITHSPCARIIKRSIFDDVQFPEERIYEDLAVIYPCLKHAKKVVFVKLKLYFYRQHPKSIIGKFSMRRANVLDVLEDLEKEVAEKHPEHLRSVHSRLLSAYFNMLRLAPLTEEYAPLIARSWAGVKRMRTRCLFDPHMRLRNKVAVLISYFGKKTLLKAIRRH